MSTRHRLSVLLATVSLIPLMFAGALPAVATPQVSKTLTLHAPSTLGSGWKQLHAINYGTTKDKLGTSLGGDGDGLQWGPSYGTQMPDGTWWYVDVAKARLAHYSSAGAYLGQVKPPKKYLTDGAELQYQDPIALKNGSLVLTGTAVGKARLLVMTRKHVFSRVTLKQWVAVHSSDGTSLYGFNTGDQAVRVNPHTGKITKVAWMRGQGGRRFNLSVGDGFLTVTRPGVNLKLKLVSAEHPDKPPHPQLEATVGADGRLWVLISAIVEISDTENADAVGLISVSTSGTVSAVQPIRNLTSDSDPGDGLHLGVRYGASKPWLMFIDTDAARVFRAT